MEGEQLLILPTKNVFNGLSDCLTYLNARGVDFNDISEVCLAAWSACFNQCGKQTIDAGFFYGEVYEYIFQKLMENDQLGGNKLEGELIIQNMLKLAETFYFSFNQMLSSIILLGDVYYYTVEGWFHGDLVIRCVKRHDLTEGV